MGILYFCAVFIRTNVERGRFFFLALEEIHSVLIYFLPSYFLCIRHHKPGVQVLLSSLSLCNLRGLICDVICVYFSKCPYLHHTQHASNKTGELPLCSIRN